MGGNKKLVAFVIGLAVSALLLGFLFKSIEWDAFFLELGRVQYRYLPLLVVLFFLGYWLRAVRWRYLLPTGAEVRTTDLFRATMFGFFATCVLPLRAGEVLRPLVLRRWSSISFSSAFASVVTERVFDVLCILAFLGVGISGGAQLPDFVQTGARVLFVLSAVIVVLMIAAYLQGELILAICRRVFTAVFSLRNPKISVRLTQLVEEFLAGLRAISGVREFALCVVYSALLWLSMAAMYWVGLLAFGVDAPFSEGVAVMVLIALAVAAPSAPGFLGTFQLGCVAALTGIYGHSQEFSLAYSILLHAYQLILAVLSGLFILRQEGWGVEMFRTSELEAQSG